MSEKVRFWLRYEFLYFLKVAFLVIIRRVDPEELALMNSTQIRYNNWYDKQVIKETIDKKDWVEVARLANEADIETYTDEEFYKLYLMKILFYVLLIITFIFFSLVLLLQLLKG